MFKVQKIIRTDKNFALEQVIKVQSMSRGVAVLFL